MLVDDRCRHVTETSSLNVIYNESSDLYEVFIANDNKYV